MPSFYARDFLRPFRLALILGNPKNAPTWEQPQWSKFAATIDPLVEAVGHVPISVEGCYGVREAPGKYKLSNFRSKNWRKVPPVGDLFGSWSLLAPSDASCSRNQLSPDLFISVANELGTMMVDLRFNPAITIAIGANLAESKSVFERAVAATADLESAVLVATTIRTWGLQSETGYNRAISEVNWFTTGLAGREPNESILDEKWDEVKTSKA